jgi:hypothetical protein
MSRFLCAAFVLAVGCGGPAAPANQKSTAVPASEVKTTVGDPNDRKAQEAARKPAAPPAGYPGAKKN